MLDTSFESTWQYCACNASSRCGHKVALEVFGLVCYRGTCKYYRSVEQLFESWTSTYPITLLKLDLQGTKRGQPVLKEITDFLLKSLGHYGQVRLASQKDLVVATEGLSSPDR